MSYSPQPDSLASRVCAFFRTHKDEELEARDIATKFGCVAHSVSTLLASAITNQLLLRVKDDDGTWVYKAGPKLASTDAAACPPPAAPDGQAPAGFKAWLAKKGTPADGQAAPSQKALPAPDTLIIEPGVPMPGPRNRLSAFAPVFARMEIGDSFAVQTPAAKRLISAATSFGKPLKRKFVTRQVDATLSRIWRTE